MGKDQEMPRSCGKLEEGGDFGVVVDREARCCYVGGHAREILAEAAEANWDV